MKNSIKREHEALLQALTPAAKREAESLGISVSQYIANLAAGFDTRPVTLRFTDSEIRRMNQIVDGGRIHEWLTTLALSALDARVVEGDGETIALRVPAKTAKRLKRAAEFEEVSVVDYLLDGLKRDLRLTEESMAVAN